MSNFNSSLIQIRPGKPHSDPVQVERFMHAINKIRSTIDRSPNVEEFIDLANAEDLRGSYFAIQDLCRYYSQLGYGKKMHDWFDKIHNLQREIGEYSDQIDFIKAAEKVSADKKVVAIKKHDLVAHKKLLAKLLVAGKWYKSVRGKKTNYDLLEKYLRKRDWHSEERDVLDILKIMSTALKDIETTHYNFSLLEGDNSLHEYRRDIRRTPAIMSLATDGLFQLDQRDGDFGLKEYLNLKNTPLAEAPFNQLPENPELKYVVRIPQHYYLAVSKVIDDLGKVKKTGQIIETLAEAYHRAKVTGCQTEEKAYKCVKKLVLHAYELEEFDYKKEAGAIYDQVEKTKLLKRYRGLLKLAREQFKAKFKSEKLLD